MEALQQIPPVNDILRSSELADLQALALQPFAGRLLDNILAEVRKELTGPHAPVTRGELTSRIATELAYRIRQAGGFSLRRVINGTGVVLHTNLGRSPLPEAAIDHMREVSTRYSNLEFDVREGRRGKRDTHCELSLQQLFECEAAIVVNNNAAAVLLALNTLAEGGEVIVSRGEEVEVGGGFRIPEVMAKSGAILCEVGATNRTSIKDYESALGENTRLLLRVHPSNFRIIGFTQRPSLAEFVALGQRRKIPTLEDLGSGCVPDAAWTGFAGEPVVIDSVRAGVDIVCFSGDKLLGGPQAGIIAGKKLFIEKMRQNPLYRALRVDKLTAAALEVVLKTYQEGRAGEIPVWRMLRASEAEIRSRVDAFVQRSAGRVRAVQLASLVGGGSVPETSLPSWGIAIDVPALSVAEIERRLRHADPPLIARIEDGKVVLDFRTIFPDEEDELLRILQQF